MGIFNFKQFVINEAHGLSRSSVMFVDVLQKKTYYKFTDFLESSENILDEKVEIKYRDLARFIDKKLYPDFPVVGFELILEFKKMIPIVIKLNLIKQQAQKLNTNTELISTTT